jgi:Uma2 family endonuclease
MTTRRRAAEDFATLKDLFEWLDRDPEARGELIDGQIIMMVGATPRHNIIKGNIFAALRSPMKAKGCQVFTADVVVRRDDVETFGAVPDVFVRCGPLSDQTARALSDPIAIFEILSPSTEQRDRSQKLLNYQAIPSVQLYVLVRQDEPRIEVWARDGGSLRPRPAVSGVDAMLALPELGTELSLAAIYDGVEFG